MARRPLTFRIQEALLGSDLPKDFRHLLHVMACVANSQTGVGWHSQASLAAFTGCSERHVRAMMTALSAADSTPVRVERRARFRRDGRGRTSDEWQLVLTHDQPAHHAAKTKGTNRHTMPPETHDQPARHAGGSDGLTGTPRTTNRHATTDQPAPGAGDHDLRSELRSELRSICPPSGSNQTNRKRAVRERPKSWEPNHQHHAFAREHGIDLEQERWRFEDHHDSKGNKFADWDAAFRTWLRNAVKFRESGTRNGRVPPQEANLAAVDRAIALATTRPSGDDEPDPWGLTP